MAGRHVEGELVIEANDVVGGADEIELTLGAGFSEWSQLSYGLSVTGASIAAETIITSWDQSAGTVTLSNQLTGDLRRISSQLVWVTDGQDLKEVLTALRFFSES